MPYVAPYVQVAADQLMEDPAFMRMTRDFLAMRREGRQNVIASLLTGGRAGGIGRVTEANMRGPDMSQLERLQDERAALIKEAVDARMKGITGATKLAAEQNKLAVALLTSAATVGAANSAASAVRYKADNDRIIEFEKGNADLLQKEGGLVAELQSLYNINADPNNPAVKAVRAINGLPKGNFAAAVANEDIKAALGETSELTPPQKAAVRIGLEAKGLTAAEVEKIAPIESEVAGLMQTEMSAAKMYADYQAAREETVAALAADLKKQGVGAQDNIRLLRSQGDDTSMAVNLNKQLQALVYGNPEMFQKVMAAAEEPLPPVAKQRLKEIEDEAAQIKAASGGKLRNDIKTDLRLNQSVKALTREAIYDAYSKKIEAVSADDPNAEQTRAKLEQQRDALAQDIAGRGGKRVERALLSAQRRFQRGQLATEVDVEGDVTRTKQRNVVAGPNDRAITMASLKRQSTDRMDAGAPGPEEIEAVQGAKELEADLGVGQGAAPVQAKRPAARPPVASAPPAASTKKPEEDDEGEEEAPPTEDTASLWRRPAANPFAKGVNKADLVSRRLEALRDGKV